MAVGLGYIVVHVFAGSTPLARSRIFSTKPEAEAAATYWRNAVVAGEIVVATVQI